MNSTQNNHLLLSRRQLIGASLGTTAAMLSPQLFAGAQKEETLADNVATAMSHSIDNPNKPYLVFSKKEYGEQWLAEMLERSKKFKHLSEHDAKRILINIQYETVRAGLDTQLVLGLIQVESGFRRYAISSAGAIGLMQVMPFWVKYIGKPGQDKHILFDIRTNLRYGCTILRHYINMENGDLYRALGRYNGSTGQPQYPNAVFAAYKSRWVYNGPM
ncbi:MAG: lytic transglycosylase domain-containing protein [Neisseriaceae bacterium]|nr:lytic transglycosylase domain-containing protein [Neisseriaceae bacterium]MBQ9259536.1 lytic transglycosylase domain-containing protein [Neisseriaceae bacterium]MBQ9725277.1 lytic transglycosylase domain-containing protein [Neisseriaceae bacterium]MBR1818581.1 lytic transglycosylase domain-containing protein [Neisseriaceae bacterium]MBR3425154.1 lytic transglycosylase domain-containing protein [Neisseriaceae bacterium]